MLAQSFQIVERPHPFGEDGIRSSLEEVARGAWRARNHPKVRAWAIEQLARHEKQTGEKVRTPRKRAEIILAAVQKKIWVPDSVGSEWMAGGHLMACDVSTKEEVCFHGSDCDDLSRLVLGCFLGVGLDAVVVGHAYDEQGHIGHVLGAVRIENEWLYADPSTSLPLGDCVKYTRERILEPVGATTICDRRGDSCLGTMRDVRVEDYVVQGTFVGVDGVPIRRRLVWRGQLASAAGDYAEKIYDQCTGGGNVSTSKTALKGYGKCAADAYCATFGVPPGICGSVVGKVFDVVDDALSNAGGAQSATYFALYQLRALHDRMVPSAAKWNAPSAWTSGMKLSPSIYAPADLVALVKGYGWDLTNPRTVALLRPADYWFNNTRPVSYYADQKAALAAFGKANVSLIGQGTQPATTSSSSSSNVAPIVVGGLALGALLWLLA